MTRVKFFFVKNRHNVDFRSYYNSVQSFLSNFYPERLCKHLSWTQLSDLPKTLYEHMNLFLTKGSHILGFTILAQHHLHVHPKRDVKPKHRRPY